MTAPVRRQRWIDSASVIDVVSGRRPWRHT
jgi:hypothetical protein